MRIVIREAAPLGEPCAVPKITDEAEVSPMGEPWYENENKQPTEAEVQRVDGQGFTGRW